MEAENKIKIFENFLPQEDCEKLYKFSIDNPQLYVDKSSNPHPFWSGRTFICYQPSIPQDIQSIITNYTSKVQVELSKATQGRVLNYDVINFVKWWDGYVQEPHADGENEPHHPPHPYPWRKFGCVYYLNDNYEGGQIHFPNFDIEIKPKANTMVLFPGDLTHLHGVRNVDLGERHTIASFWKYE